jgi:hypothetical protein
MSKSFKKIVNKLCRKISSFPKVILNSINVLAVSLMQAQNGFWLRHDFPCVLSGTNFIKQNSNKQKRHIVVLGYLKKIFPNESCLQAGYPSQNKYYLL